MLNIYTLFLQKILPAKRTVIFIANILTWEWFLTNYFVPARA